MLQKHFILVLCLVFSFAPGTLAAEEEEFNIFSIINEMGYDTETDKLRYFALVQMLQMNPELVHARNEQNETPLHIAVHISTAQTAHKVSQLLIRKGADVNAADNGNVTPLTWGAQHARVVKLLLQDGAYVRTIDGEEGMALFTACLWRSPESVELLIKAGADIEKGDNRSTPLHIAAHKVDEKVIRLLLLAGACVDPEDRKGSTPCMNALTSFEELRWYRRGKEPLKEALGAFLEFGIPLTVDKEVAELKKDPELYEHARKIIDIVRSFWRDHIPVLEKNYFLGEDCKCLQLLDAVRGLLLDFIATPVLPKKDVVEPHELVSATEVEEELHEPQQDQILELEQEHDDASGESFFEQDAADIQREDQTNTDIADDEEQDFEGSTRDNSWWATSCTIL